ncbi:MAG: hypothetical protein Q4D13_09090 [Erysipelotrichaceae bacterium]|nr:hypothetical protein [Erysipelotrichaceae bacterium]
MNTTLRFHSGLDTIGGVILEIRYGNDRIFLEAGSAYYPDSQLPDKSDNLISYYLKTNQIPHINGIFPEKYLLEYSDIIPSEKYEGNQAFFISHLHLDHMKLMGLIDPDIPVYLSKPAQILESALEDIGEGVDTIRGLNYSDMKEEISVGNIKVTPILLNDFSYQDYSFYIETPDLKIHYTGDIFIYGPYKENILHKEIPFLNKKGVDILVCEGTTFHSEHTYDNIVHSIDEPVSLDKLHQRIINKINSHKGLCLFNIYDREMSDVSFFMNYADKTGRTIVFDSKTAYLYNRFFNKSTNYIVEDNTDESEYLKYVKEHNNPVTREEILNNPSEYLLQTDYEHLNELKDYSNLNCLYLHHSGMPLGPFDCRYQKMLDYLESLNIEYCYDYKDKDGIFSPHAVPEQLLAYIDMVNADLVVPCHTSNRKEYIRNINHNSYCCLENKTYTYNKDKKTLEEM